jgi:MFS family permease
VPMPTADAAPAYRWVIAALLILALMSQAVTWLAPAPILGPIIKDLHIALGSAGLIISIIALCIAIFSFLGAIVAEKLGALRALLLGLWLMAFAEIASGYSRSFATLIACRVVEGVGYGILIAPPGTLTMEWFAEREWPYVNMVLALCSYIGLTAVFSITAPIYLAFGSSWGAVLKIYGVAVAAVAALWTVFGRERVAHRVRVAVTESVERRSALGEVMRMRGVQLIAACLFGGMWVFQLYTAFLPEFFRIYRGFGLAEASSLTAVLPLAGIFAAAAGGIGTGMTGLRKPFTWPVSIATLVGCLGAITLPGAGAIRVSLVLVGIGAAGSLSALITLLMELPGMTPAKMGTSLAFVWAVGYAGAFISPFLGGALASAIGLKAVMLGFLVFQLLPIVMTYLLPETGPARARVEVSTAAL